MKIRTEHLVVAGGVALLFAGVILFGAGPRGLGQDPKNKRQGSSHYTTPAGGKAYYALLKRMDFPVRRHERKIELLPKETRMFAILAPTNALDGAEVEWLRKWVAQGGTLLWSARRGAGGAKAEALLAAFGLECAPGGTGGEVRAELDGASYTLAVTPSYRLRGGRALAADVVVEVAHGKGRFVAVAEPELAGNAGLAKGENAAFLVHLARRGSKGGEIAFDEFHHGFAEGQEAFAILWDSPLGGAVAILSVAAFLGVFAGGRRLGPPIDLHEERRRRPAEFVEAFANLCLKMRAGPQALSMVLGEFRLFLQKRCGSADPAVAERVAVRAGLAPGSLKAALDRGRKLAAARRAEGDALVACARELESMRRIIERKPK